MRNTEVGIDPPGRMYPLCQRTQYHDNPTRRCRTECFVPEERVPVRKADEDLKPSNSWLGPATENTGGSGVAIRWEAQDDNHVQPTAVTC
jgi:hypothetical protein